jgi:hypothetical protein
LGFLICPRQRPCVALAALHGERGLRHRRLGCVEFCSGISKPAARRVEALNRGHLCLGSLERLRHPVNRFRSLSSLPIWSIFLAILSKTAPVLSCALMTAFASIIFAIYQRRLELCFWLHATARVCQ